MITALASNERFVFGSNLAGRHGAGAARQAMDDFGAEYGVGEGLTGSAYAFPTLDEHFQKVPLRSLVASRDRLYATAAQHPELTFLLTKVGCGLAGFEESTMRALFCAPVARPANIILPEDWR